MEMSELVRDNKKLKIENTKHQGNIRGLQKQKEELQSQLKMLERAINSRENEDEGSQND